MNVISILQYLLDVIIKNSKACETFSTVEWLVSFRFVLVNRVSHSIKKKDEKFIRKPRCVGDIIYQSLNAGMGVKESEK